MTAGIYCITCTATAAFYVGQTASIRSRWKSHQAALKCNKHSNERLQTLFNQHGLEAFEFSVLEECLTADLEVREVKWIERLKPSLNFTRDEVAQKSQKTRQARIQANNEAWLKTRERIREEYLFEIWGESTI